MCRRVVVLTFMILVATLVLIAAVPVPDEHGAFAVVRAAAPVAPVVPAAHHEDEDVRVIEVAPHAGGHGAEVFYFNSGTSWLGVSIADINEERASELGLGRPMGAEIKAVVPDSPAAEAGLKKGDIILEFQNTPVQGVSQLTRLVRETPPGRTVSLEIQDEGSRRTVDIKITERESEHDIHKIISKIGIPDVDFEGFDMEFEVPDIDIDLPHIMSLGAHGGGVRMGVMVETLTDQLGEFFGVEDGGGVLIRRVEKGSAGEEAGLRAGDVIIGIDDQDIASSSALRRAVRENAGKTVAVTIVRDRRETEVSVTLPEKKSPSKWEWHMKEGDEEGLHEATESLHQEAMRIREESRRMAAESRLKAREQRTRMREMRARIRETKEYLRGLKEYLRERTETGEGVPGGVVDLDTTPPDKSIQV